MNFYHIYIQAFSVILILMTTLWFVSVIIKNVNIVDLFWGLGFVMITGFYFLKTDGFLPGKIILMIMVTIWGLRLSVYLNKGKLYPGKISN